MDHVATDRAGAGVHVPGKSRRDAEADQGAGTIVDRLRDQSFEPHRISTPRHRFHAIRSFRDTRLSA
jgi:hypothetical protein